MSKVIIMGMIFDEGSVPDFGSIYRVCERQNNVHDYGLDSADVSKLDLITNAAPGSTALCDDTADIYRLTKTGWVKFGEPAQAAGLSSVSPLHTSLNIDRAALFDMASADVEPDGEIGGRAE